MTTVPLKGAALIQTVESLGENASRQELCQATGYITTDKSGKTKLLYNAMLGEILAAKGLDLPTQRGSGGPTPSFTTSTLSNGQVVIGRCYAKMLESSYKDSWNIEVDEEARSITITLQQD